MGVRASRAALVPPQSSGEGGVAEVNPHVHVGCASEQPEKAGALDLPDIPDTVIAQIHGLGKREVELVKLRLDQAQRFIGILLAEGSEDRGENFPNHRLLVWGKRFDGQSDAWALRAAELNGLGALFGAELIDQRGVALFSIQHREELIGALGLIPIGVAGMRGGFAESVACGMTVKDGAAKGRACERISIAAAGAMATRENKLEALAVRFAEEGDGGAGGESFAFGVVDDLIEHALRVLR